MVLLHSGGGELGLSFCVFFGSFVLKPCQSVHSASPFRNSVWIQSSPRFKLLYTWSNSRLSRKRGGEQYILRKINQSAFGREILPSAIGRSRSPTAGPSPTLAAVATATAGICGVANREGLRVHVNPVESPLSKGHDFYFQKKWRWDLSGAPSASFFIQDHIFQLGTGNNGNQQIVKKRCKKTTGFYISGEKAQKTSEPQQ